MGNDNDNNKPPFLLSGDEKAPESGKKYNVKNFGYGHFVTDADSKPVDNNPIDAWGLNKPETANQLWLYKQYPSTKADIVFTLQCVSTLNDRSTIGDRGGYMSVDYNSKKLVQSGAPFPWILTEPSPKCYKVMPAFDLYSSKGTLFATDLNPKVQTVESTQISLNADTNAVDQLWTFI